VTAIVVKYRDWGVGIIMSGEERPLLAGDEESVAPEPAVQAGEQSRDE